MKKEKNGQIEKIKKAKNAYLLDLAPRAKTERFAIYLDLGKGEQMHPIWPDDCDLGKDANLLPHQVYSKRDRGFAAFHFTPDYKQDLVKMLKDINPKIKVFAFEYGAYLYGL